ncbi:unnamed protein product [Mytilus edulis]|uniref:WSC domain-containing protein n=1 Tax=Mytilus edulis TaxID=6550 RepID=A0A8S3U114_MYTED|nr:unnamed protein product [Mytilus edulis]
MVTFWNSLTLYLLLEIYQLSIVWSVSTSTIHIIPGDEVLFNCSEYSSITIRNVSVQNTGKCESRQDDCYLNRNDHELIKRCEGYPSCFVNGSLLTSSCLWEDLYFDLSYICKAASYEYTGCYVDDPERVLDESHKDNQAMSADICFEICTEYQTSDKYEYFGTQYGHECFCGDGQQLNSYHYNKLKESECSMPCLRNEDEMCGGFYRMSVYKITTTHKQEGNYDTLSTNRKSAEHMYASIEQESTEPDLSQYQSLTNPPESDIHAYASTELTHLNINHLRIRLSPISTLMRQQLKLLYIDVL